MPGIPILPGEIPRNSQGQIDIVQLIGSITRRILFIFLHKTFIILRNNKFYQALGL